MENVFLSDRWFQPSLTPAAIHSRLLELAHRLSIDYKDKACLAVPVLQGAFLFASDLLRECTFLPDIHFIRVSSYGAGMTSKGALSWFLELPPSLEGKHVLLIEDIVDTGLTIANVREVCEARNAASVKVAALLFKSGSFQGGQPPEYVGFDIPNDFVVGYGLDYAGLGRNLRGIYRVVEE